MKVVCEVTVANNCTKQEEMVMLIEGGKAKNPSLDERI